MPLNTLLDELRRVLSLQAGHESLDDFFTRQVHERELGDRMTRPREGWVCIRLVDGLVRVVEEQWSLDQLTALGEWHPRRAPRYENAPLVVFRGWSRQFLIDGQNRVNLWRTQGRSGPHRVLVVEPRKEHPDPFPRD